MASLVAAWRVGIDGKLFRYAWQVYCPACGFLGMKTSYHYAEQLRAEHRCGEEHE